MFSPLGRELERGWPGRIEGDRVVQFAAQTLQAFFTGGGTAREHDVFARADVELRAPVLHPSAVRLFEAGGSFRFENTAAVHGPGARVSLPAGATRLLCVARIAVVIGGDGHAAGFTIYGEWRAPELEPPKATDFARSLGPVVVTPDELDPGGGWGAFVAYAARNTVLRPGDVLALPPLYELGPFGPGDDVELAVKGIGVLRSGVA
jgi:hypothetical protein